MSPSHSLSLGPWVGQCAHGSASLIRVRRLWGHKEVGSQGSRWRPACGGRSSVGSLDMLGVDRWSWSQGEGCTPPPTLSSEVSAHHGIQVTSGQWKTTPDTPRALGLRSVRTVGWEARGEGRGWGGVSRWTDRCGARTPPPLGSPTPAWRILRKSSLTKTCRCFHGCGGDQFIEINTPSAK